MLNSFNSFVLEFELYIPEYIKLELKFSCSYPGIVVDTFTPLSICGALKSSRILSDSTPLPKL
jgi:hypothetical protein